MTNKKGKKQSPKRSSRSTSSKKNDNTESKTPEVHDLDEPMSDMTTDEFFAKPIAVMEAIGTDMGTYEALPGV